MDRQPAKALEPGDVRRLLALVQHQRHPCRNRIIVLLSFKAGLRACAGLRWSMVLSSDHHINSHMNVARSIAKGGSGRQIPLHDDLRRSLRILHRSQGHPRDGPVVASERGGAMTARSIVNWFHGTYAELGLVGCSSHSGRRTFITAAARLLATTGGSLRDVQELAGHRALTTTERYIEGNRAAQRKLIARL
jgi:integrase/recombinase XerC